MQKERQIGETEDEKNEELDFETLNEKDTILPLFIDDKNADNSSCQSYNDTCQFFWQYDLWVSVTLIVNGVSPYISHITKYTWEVL